MTISMKRAKEAIHEMKEDGVNANSLGFVATVLRDNELDDDLHDFYQLVLNYINETEEKIAQAPKKSQE